MGCGCAVRSTRGRKKKDPTAWRDTPEGLAKYREARAEAQRKANETGFDYMVEANDLFKSFSVSMLPQRQNRYGHELRGEVVSCENLSKCQVGHGPRLTRIRKRGAARFVPDVATKAKAADRRYGYFRPDDVFVVETGNLEEGPRKKIAERIFDKADDPYVSVSVGRLTVAPSKHSYFGDALFVAIKEALHRPHRFEPGGNRFVLL